MTDMGTTVDWGRTAYREAWDRQLELVEQRKAGDCPDTLVFTEHDPVFTIGARPGAEQHLVWTEQVLSQQVAHPMKNEAPKTRNKKSRNKQQTTEIRKLKMEN